MKSLTTLISVTATATALVTFNLCTIAWADTGTGPRSVTVHYDDLDANNVRGAAILYQRIKVAAESVCSDLGPKRSLALLSRYSSCVQAAMGDAVTRVNLPAVTDYALARGTGPAGPAIKVKVARND